MEHMNNKLWKILKEMGISDHLTCLLRNLYAGQEATVRLIFFPTHHFSLPENPSIVYSLFMCYLFPLEVKLHESKNVVSLINQCVPISQEYSLAYSRPRMSPCYDSNSALVPGLHPRAKESKSSNTVRMFRILKRPFLTLHTSSTHFHSTDDPPS